MHVVVSFFTGIVFAIGLVVSGMARPSKIIGFLDIAGDWDPTLAFVMGGALAIYLPAYRLIRRRTRPLMAPTFQIPTCTDLTPQLVIGSALFGLGWGLAGFCPGPALTALPTMTTEVLGFTAGILLGIGLLRVVSRSLQDRPSFGPAR